MFYIMVIIAWALLLVSLVAIHLLVKIKAMGKSRLEVEKTRETLRLELIDYQDHEYREKQKQEHIRDSRRQTHVYKVSLKSDPARIITIVGHFWQTRNDQMAITRFYPSGPRKAFCCGMENLGYIVEDGNLGSSIGPLH